MKKLIIIALAFVGLHAMRKKEGKKGQNQGERGEKMMNLSAEDIAT